MIRPLNHIRVPGTRPADESRQRKRQRAKVAKLAVCIAVAGTIWGVAWAGLAWGHAQADSRAWIEAHMTRSDVAVITVAATFFLAGLLIGSAPRILRISKALDNVSDRG